MELLNAEGQDWWQSRAGRITASQFYLAFARYKSGKNKGEWQSAARDYAFKLAIERISGEPLRDESFEPWEARRGRELEPEARAQHAFLHDLDIENGGVAVTHCGRFAASADGLIEPNGGAEYKAFLNPAKLRPLLLADQMPDETWAQIQGGLWVTGRQWWHLGLYCPALAPIGRDLTVIPVQRDPEYINELEVALFELDALVEHYRGHLEQKEAA